MLKVARLESFDLPVFMFQTIWTKAQSTSLVQGLSYRLMLSQFLLDVGVEIRRHKPMTKQFDPINVVMAQRSFSHEIGPHYPVVHPQLPPVDLLEDVERRMIIAFEQAIAPLIKNLAAMNKIRSQIELRQQTLERALKESWEDIMEMIDDVEIDLVMKLKKKMTL
ncbi:hypothetical protein CJ030_MR6G018844 [Morella rubra]|uniref:Uncharacterized protein n=1 Tax=Morella rubra TaxID=262757 RepID=A0A6A1VAE2_9ROSI|nr:hypothetical protein CJ030_MR6G018844 [Morella rubra]